MQAHADPLAALEVFQVPPDRGTLSVDEPPEALLALLLSSWTRRAGGRGLLRCHKHGKGVAVVIATVGQRELPLGTGA